MNSKQDFKQRRRHYSPAKLLACEIDEEQGIDVDKAEEWRLLKLRDAELMRRAVRAAQMTIRSWHVNEEACEEV